MSEANLSVDLDNINLNKHVVTYKYNFKIPISFGDNPLYQIRSVTSIIQIMSENNFIEGKDYDIFKSYDGINISSNNADVITYARLLF